MAQKEREIAELRDEACTLWASGWLFFRHKASKVFLGLHLDFLVPIEDEMGESESDREDDLGVSLAAPSSTFLPGNPVVEVARPPSSDTYAFSYHSSSFW